MAKRADWSVAAMNKALLDELCTGRQFLDDLKRKYTEEEIEARRQAREARGAKGGSMKLAATIPASAYFQIIAQEGHEFFDDRKSVRWWLKQHPEFKSANV